MLWTSSESSACEGWMGAFDVSFESRLVGKQSRASVESAGDVLRAKTVAIASGHRRTRKESSREVRSIELSTLQKQMA